MREIEEDIFKLTGDRTAKWVPEENKVVLRVNGFSVIEENVYALRQLSEWLRQKDIARHQLYARTNYKDHITLNGETLCDYNVRTPNTSDADSLTPLPNTTEREWRVILATRSLCSGCHSTAAHAGLMPYVPEGMPKFPCPECGKGTTNVGRYMGAGIANHDDGESHKFDIEIFEQWRRAENPEEIDSTWTRSAFN